jgi:beta-lactamase superfamily II metal-dependent hydrolase
MRTVLFLGIIVAALPASAQGVLKIIHFDVGQGDATLVISPSGKTMLVDGGNQGQGTKVIVPRLKRLNIEKLDYVIATHFDADHIAGLDEVLKAVKFSPGGVLDHGNKGPLKVLPLLTDKGNPTRYGDYANAANLAETREPVAMGRGVIDLGADIIVTVVAANGCALGAGETQYRKGLDKNGASVALVITHGTFDYFIGGDLTGGGPSKNPATADMETPVATRVGHVDALRLSHHGSDTSSNKGFLETLRPTVAVISVGDGGVNKGYFLPNRLVLDRLHDIRELGLKAVFATNEGETARGLSTADRKLIRVAERDVTIRSSGDRFTVNGIRYQSDGAISPAAGALTPLRETCTSNLETSSDT